MSISDYKIFSLSELIIELGEERVNDILSSFSSPLNPEIEYFIKNTAVPLDKQSVSKTHLVFGSDNGLILLGYFSLTNKMFSISFDGISGVLKKKLIKFAAYDDYLKEYRISAPLIAQLGKNFTNGYNTLITGSELLEMACDVVSEAQLLIGGKIVYLECADKKGLTEFYEKNNFKKFGVRQLNRNDEKETHDRYLLQYLKYM